MSLQGHLKDMSLASLIQLKCQETASARIALTNSYQRGEVYLSDGQIVHASLGTATGCAALYELLSWDHGLFVFERDVHAPERTIAADWHALLLEGIRQTAERAAQSAALKAEPPEIRRPSTPSANSTPDLAA